MIILCYQQLARAVRVSVHCSIKQICAETLTLSSRNLAGDCGHLISCTIRAASHAQACRCKCSGPPRIPSEGFSKLDTATVEMSNTSSWAGGILFCFFCEGGGIILFSGSAICGGYFNLHTPIGSGLNIQRFHTKSSGSNAKLISLLECHYR